MFFLNKKALLAASVAALMPMTASAVTVMADISADQTYTFAEVLPVGGDVDFMFTAKGTPAFNISNFALTASGNNGGVDVGDITFGFSEVGNVSPDSFDTIVVSPGPQGNDVATGLDFLASNGPLIEGDTWTIFFNDGIIDDVSITLSFNTSSIPVPTVPVPAAGLMLGAALIGGGFAARRRKS